jgi:phospholipid-binding lipoprotein MlaA
MKHLCAAATVLIAALTLSACSTPSPESLAVNDPWELTNRDTFAFDVWIDHHIARPIAETYQDIVPEPARDGLHNAVTNMHAPVVLANDALQARPKRAARTLGRIIINTTVGLGGLIDVASKIGIPYHDNDFGVTLGVAGVAEGSYLILPFLGPKPPRDILGSFADGAFDPMTYARFDGRGTFLTVRSTFNILDTEAQNMDQVQGIERTSIDFYASARSLYRQHRAAQIRGDQPDDFQLLPNL